jgi:hypothetical protein
MANDDTRVVTMFIFGESGLKELPGLFDLIEYHNRTGKWLEIVEHKEPAPPRSGRINGIARARSEPRAAPETLIAELTDIAPPLTVIGPMQNGYVPVQVWIYAPRLTVSE